MPVSISKLPEVTNVKDNSFMLITQDGTTKRTMCDQFVAEEEARLDEFSPTVITSKSMSKTGEGDNVDYSSSVYDAPMKDVVLKGKTMVNCIQEPSSQDVVLPYEFEEGQYVTINDTKESGALGVELKGQTLVNVLPSVNDDRFLIENSTTLERLKDGFLRVNAPHNGRWQIATNTIPIKPSTNYLLITEVKNNTVDGRITLANTTGFTTNSLTKVDIGFNGVLKQIITTRDVLEDYIFQGWLDSGTTGFVDIRNTLIEYQNGMENWDIPYFTGMTSCKMPILCTVGKNLFDLTNAPNGYLTADNPYTLASSDHNNKTSAYIKVKPNTKYTYSFDGFTPSQVGNTYWTGFYYYKRIGEVSTVHPSRITFSSSSEEHKQITFTTPSDCNYIRIGSRGLMLNGATAQLEEATSATSYEPYKTSILSLPEEVVLRGIGDVQDTLDCLTGEVTERIGEIVLNGSENWVKPSTQPTNTSRFLLLDFPNNKNAKILSNIRVKNNAGEDKIGIWCDTNTVLNVDTSVDTVESLKVFLSENPIKLQYSLATESVRTVDLNVVDQNGSVIPTLKSWNTTTHIYSEIPENSLYPTLSHSNPTYPVILKPSTKYSIVANSYSNDHTNSTINFNLGGATASTTVGNRVTTITTPSTLTSEELVMSGRGNKLNNVMVIEGDVAGDEPYFEGICDCKSPILSNVGKNLFNINGEINEKFSNMFANDAPNTVDGNTIIASSWTANYHGKGQKIKVKRGKLYTCSFTTSDNGNVVIHTPNKVNFTPVKSSTFTFTAPTDCDEIIVAFNTHGASSGGKIHNLCVVEGEVTSVEYESYKSNTTNFEQKDGKTIVLRSLPSGVCDTLNVETGEYVQRIGEVVLDGSQDGAYDYVSDESLGLLTIRLPKIPNIKNDGVNLYGLLSNKYNSVTNKSPNNIYAYNGRVMMTKSLSELELFNTSDKIKLFLSQNPITVQYPLATLIVSTIDVQGFPYAYKDGHVQLSSGSIEQSLTPKVEYNIATNRGGQITQNTKSLIRQGKLLNDIESKINQIIEATVNDGIMLMKLRNK